MDKEKKDQQGKYWNRFWTVPTLFTLLRIASSVTLVSYLAINGLSPTMLLGIPSSVVLPAWTIATAASDFIDGTLARTLHQQSKWGKALDPIADKVLNWGIGLTLMGKGIMPLWPLLIAGRDVAIGAITISQKYKDGKKQKLQQSSTSEKDDSKKEKSFVKKAKEYYKTFRLGEAMSPTYPAKLKMFFQSASVISTLAFGFGTTGISMLAPLLMGSAILTIPFEIYAVKNKYFSKHSKDVNNISLKVTEHQDTKEKELLIGKSNKKENKFELSNSNDCTKTRNVRLPNYEEYLALLGIDSNVYEEKPLIKQKVYRIK